MKDFLYIMPEILIAVTLAFVVASEITHEGERFRLITMISLLGLGSAFFYTIYSYQYGSKPVFGGGLCLDGFSLFFKLIFIALAALSTVSVGQTKEIDPTRRKYAERFLYRALPKAAMLKQEILTPCQVMEDRLAGKL